MKIYLKKAKYNDLFYHYFKHNGLNEYIDFNDFAKFIMCDKGLIATYTKQSLYSFLKWSHCKYQLMYFGLI